MNNKYKLDQLISMLRYEYPHYPCTFSNCCNKDKGCKNSARGGGECDVCIAKKIALLVGCELAFTFHKTTAQASQLYCEMVEKLERQGGIENVY